MTSDLTLTELEIVYDTLARAIDSLDAGEEPVFLAKLVLALARETGDLASFERALAIAQRTIPGDAS